MVVAGGVLLAIAALLAVPLCVAFRLEGLEPFTGRLTVRWLFGLVRVRVRIPRARAAAAGRAPGPKRAPRRAGRRRRVGPGKVVAVLRQGAFRRRLRRLAAELVRAAHLTGLRLRMRLGLGDPADTGRLWAVIGPLSAAAHALRDADVRVEPEFVDPVLEFDARGRMTVVPLQVLGLAVRFALSPASIRAWRTLWAGDA